MRHSRYLAPLTAIILSVLWLGGAAAAVASTHHAPASCVVDVDVTHTASQVQAHGTACGDRYRAVGYWGGDRDLGTYMLSAYSTACDVSPSCQGHKDGTLFSGGWQDRRTGKYRQTFTVNVHAHTTALVRRKCTSTYDFGLGLHNDENGGQADWETNCFNFTMQVRVECRNNITGADYYVYSGEVHGLEIDDWAACNFPDYVADFWIDPKDTNHWLDV